MGKRTGAVFLILFLLFVSPTPSPAAAQDPEEAVAEIMSRMSVEDKVGQLFIVPFVGSGANPDSDIYQLITEYKVGGVILLAANSNFNNDASTPHQIAELTNTLKTTAFHTNGIPLFIAIDHEGDAYPYTRITGGVSPIPSQMAIGATWDTTNAEAIGRIVGEELAAMGINLLLGPSLDVLNDPRPTGRGDIGIRVFGGDPYWVSQMGRAYIRGVHQGSQGRMATVAKHFPGHGGSDRLPDNEVATVDKSLQELRRIELPPFFHVTASQEEDPLGTTDALMSSHIRYRGFQGDIRQFTAPISFDADGMETLLNLPQIQIWREDGGLIVSDALGVPAVRKHFDPALETFPHRRIAKEAFLAGNDILSLVQFDLRSIWSDQFANIKDTIFFFQTEYINNPAFAARVDAAVSRILRLKLQLYPELTLDTLNVSPDQALAVGGQAGSTVHNIARESLTLLYPSSEELRQRIPQPPRADEKLLIITDTRLARACYTQEGQPADLVRPRTAIEEMILRLYGPGATGQIQPDQISTITFTELKMALGGAIVPSPAPAEENPSSPEIIVSPEEVGQRIQAANWLIFAALDLNTSRYSDSNALKLFLDQESGTLLDKKTVVLAFSAPYYLDTTEVTKLTAYLGLYSKTSPHIEAAVRALFGEIGFPGASPVSVEAIGYELVDILAPNPAQELMIEAIQILPESKLAPVSVEIRVGPVMDRNGHPVPDGTPIEIKALIDQRPVTSEMAHTEEGMAEAILTLSEPGETQIVAAAGQNVTSESIWITVLALPTATWTPTPSPATTTPTATSDPTPTPTTTPTPPPSPAPLSPEETTPPTAPTTDASSQVRPLDGLDLTSALGAILLAGLVGFWFGQGIRKPLSGRMRGGLWVLIGGLAAYLLYGSGWIRPDQWLFEQSNLLASRISLAGLVFLFGLIAVGLSSQNSRQQAGRGPVTAKSGIKR